MMPIALFDLSSESGLTWLVCIVCAPPSLPDQMRIVLSDRNVPL